MTALSVSFQMLGQIWSTRLNLAGLLLSVPSSVLGTEKELNKQLWNEKKTEWIQLSLEDWSALAHSGSRGRYCCRVHLYTQSIKHGGCHLNSEQCHQNKAILWIAVNCKFWLYHWEASVDSGIPKARSTLYLSDNKYDVPEAVDDFLSKLGNSPC